MNKIEFLNALATSLKGFSHEEIGRVLSYFDELISDKIEMGENEYQVVFSLGDIKTISKQIQLELAGERLKSSKSSHKDYVKNINQNPTSNTPTNINQANNFAYQSVRNNNFPQNPHYKYDPTIVPNRVANYANQNVNAYPINSRQTDFAPQPYQQYMQPQVAESKKKKSTLGIVFKLFMTPGLILWGVLLATLFLSAGIAIYATVLGLGLTSVSLLVATGPAVVVAAADGGAFALMVGGGMIAAGGICGLLTIIAERIGTAFMKLMLKFATRVARGFYGKKKKTAKPQTN